MGANTGSYTRGGDPAAMFDEQNLYLAELQQSGKAAVDADFNDAKFSLMAQLRRIIENAIGDGSPNDGFLIAESVATNVNNFVISGGDGSDDGAGRLFAAGFQAMLRSDVEYNDGLVDALQKKLMPQITGLAPLVLTDSTANWTVNEHAGKTLTPDVDTPGTTFTIVSNTSTTLTIGAGDMTAGASVGAFYRIELSTPSGSNRIDEVYLDLFLDEVDDAEDTNLVHTDLAPSQSAAFRLALRQFVRVKEGGVTPAGHVDLDGRQHYTLKIATLNRLNGNNTITAAMIVDERETFLPGAGAITVEEVDLAPSIAGVKTLRFPNGTVTDLGGGIVEITVATGGGAGEAARLIPFSLDITGETGPNLATVGVDVDVAEYVTGQDRSQKVKFEVPDDYDSGDIDLLVVYRMDSAEPNPNNQLQLQTRYQVVDVSAGSITDSGNVSQVFTTLETTNFERRVVLTIPDADVAPGDTVTTFFRRIGTGINDLHGGNLEVVGFQVRYFSSLAGKGVTQKAEAYFNATGEPATGSGTIGTDIEVTTFPDASSSAIKASFIVPDEWDGLSSPVFHCSYVMSSALAAVVRLELSAEVVNPTTGLVTSVAAEDFDLATTADTNPHRSTVIFAINPTLLVPGAHIKVVLARRGADAADTHTGIFQLIDFFMSIGISLGIASSANAIERYLNAPDLTQISGTIDANSDPPDVGGDFELWERITGAAAGTNEGHISYQGKLGTGLTTIGRIEVPLRGSGATPQHRLRVYVEGAGLAFDSGLIGTPLTRQVTTLTSGDLSAQPTAGKRYVVRVECVVENGESVRSGRPFVREE